MLVMQPSSLLTKDEDKKPDSALEKFFAKRRLPRWVHYFNVLGNGLPGTTMEAVQAGSLFLGTGLLAFWREGVVTGTLDKTALYGKIGGLGMASMVYGY